MALWDKLVSDKAFAELETLYTDNEKLKAENERHENLVEVVAERLTKACDEKRRLESLVEEQERQLADFDATKEQLEAANKERDAAKRELDELRAFFRPLAPEPMEYFAAKCKGIRDSVYTLITSNFDRDIEDGILANEFLWKSIEKDPYLNSISIPATNSPVARQMRNAVILAVFGRALCKHIFLPTFILEKGQELAEVMSEDAQRDTEWEIHARSMVLAMSPHRQRDNAKKNTEAAVNEIFEHAQHFLSFSVSKDDFRNDLYQVCTKICEQWKGLQQVKPKVEPSLDLCYSDSEEWEAFSLPSAKSVVDETKTKANGTSSKGTKQHSKVTTDAIHRVLWPSFSLIQDQEEPVVAKGLVLLKSQTRKATEEIMDQPIKKLSKRERRVSERLSNGSNLNGTGKNFLHPGGGGGSKGGA